MATANEPSRAVLDGVVDAGGNLVIPADKLRVAAGTRVRVDVTVVPDSLQTFEGVLADWPDLSWEDFERGSQLAVGDLNLESAVE